VRKLADGTVRYTAQIRIKRDGAQVYQETQSFVRKQAAQAWIRRREAELYEPDAIEKANRVGIPLAEIIDRYLRLKGFKRFKAVDGYPDDVAEFSQQLGVDYAHRLGQ